MYRARSESHKDRKGGLCGQVSVVTLHRDQWESWVPHQLRLLRYSRYVDLYPLDNEITRIKMESIVDTVVYLRTYLGTF